MRTKNGVIVNRKDLRDKIDEMIKLDGMWEMFDGMIIGIGLDMFDEKVLSTLNPIYEEPINKLVDAFLTNDYVECVIVGGEIAAMSIPTPLIDGSENEIVLYQTVLQGIVMLITGLAKVEKAKIEESN